MADTNATRSALLQAFKEVYGEEVAEQANRASWIYKEFEKANKRRFGGKYWTAPMQDEGGQAIGSYNEDEEVADAQAEVYKEMQVLPRQHYGTVRLSGLAIKASANKLYAFIQAKDSEIKNKTKSLISRLNANIYQRGDGRICTITAADATTVTCAAGTNMNWFRKGMRFDVFAAAGFPTTKRGTSRAHGTKKQGFQITAVNKTTRVITYSAGGVAGDLTGGSAAANTDILVYEDTQDSSSTAATSGATDTAGKNLLGLRSLVDDTSEGPTTIQNISRATFPIFKSAVLSNSGTARPLSLDLLQNAIDQTAIEADEEPDFIIGGFGQRRNYFNLLVSDVRYAPQEFKGGFKTLMYNNLAWQVDKDCEPGRLYIGVKEAIKRFEIAPLGILDEGSAGGMLRLPKTDVYELLIGGYFNMGIDRPNAWAKLVDLIEPS